MTNAVKTAIITGVFGTIAALITAFVALHPSNKESGDGATAKVAEATPFSQKTPIPLSPADRSDLSGFPRNLELRWSEVAGATAYRVETQMQVNGPIANSVQWVDMPVRMVTANHCQIEWGGANLGRWKVTAVDGNGMTSTSSDWSTFKFLQ